MADNSLLARLDGIESRFEEVSTLITDPDVIADMKRYVKLTKEYKDLEKLTAVTRRYRSLLGNISEAREVLETESDHELRQMAKEELDEATDALPGLEEEIKLLLVPADPEDGKNVVLEIRGGTGGDEAAILPETSLRCIPNTASRKVGVWRSRAVAKGLPEASRKSLSV